MNKNETIENIKSIIYALAIALVLRAVVIEANFIFSGSMTPTLLAGDYVLVNKMAYGIKVPIPFTNDSIDILKYNTPKKGDIITFRYPQDPTKIFVKRAIGLPGDIIELNEQELYINNKLITRIKKEDFDLFSYQYDEYIKEKPHLVIHKKIGSMFGTYGPIKVPDDSIFVLGDNRDNSHDSRFWGYVPFKNVLGKTLVIYFSNSETLFSNGDLLYLSSLSPINIFNWIKGIRLKRITTILWNA